MDDDALGLAVSGVLAALISLHGVDYQAVGLEEFGRPDGYAARQLRRWTGQWELVASDDAETRRTASALASRLTDSVPEQRSSTIVHGDYRIDNTLLDLGDTPRVLAIVDWELSTIGDPVADVALMCAYRHPALDLVQGKPSSWTSGRLPSPHALAGRTRQPGASPRRTGTSTWRWRTSRSPSSLLGSTSASAPAQDPGRASRRLVMPSCRS